MITNHIGLKVRNVEKSQNFYCENLGFIFDSKYEDENVILVFLKNENSVIELVHHKNKIFNSVKNGVIDHIAFTVNNIKQYIDKLKNNNVKFITNEVLTVNDKLITFFEGPDGEKLELVQYIKN